MFEPLLGQHAPALDDLAAARHVRSLCHEKVRKEENGRQRNGTNQSARLPDILWKTFILSSDAADSELAVDRRWRQSAPLVIARSTCDEATQTFLAALDCFAEPVIGRAFAGPVGSQ